MWITMLISAVILLIISKNINRQEIYTMWISVFVYFYVDIYVYNFFFINFP